MSERAKRIEEAARVLLEAVDKLTSWTPRSVEACSALQEALLVNPLDQLVALTEDYGGYEREFAEFLNGEQRWAIEVMANYAAKISMAGKSECEGIEHCDVCQAEDVLRDLLAQLPEDDNDR